MRRHDGLLGVISVVLVISMLIGLGSVLTGAGFSEPENPLGTNADPLIPEMLDGSGKLAGEGEEQDATTPPEETPPPTEPEETEPTKPEETEPPTEPEEAEPTEPEETEPAEENEPTVPPEEPSEPEPGPDENVGETEPGTDDGGNSDSGNVDDGPAGDDGNGPGEGGETPGEGNDDSVKIRTSLENAFFTKSELPDGVLEFYAYPSKDDAVYSMKVVMNNASTPANGKVLTSSDGINYEAQLLLNETTIITLFLKENGETISYVRYQIRYEAEKANEDNPEVGDHPPSIITNLDGFTDVMETQDFLFWVSARTNPEGNPIYSNQIEVWLNGELVPKQTGDVRPEYELHFEPPNVGDNAKYTVKVRAWDGKGNSTMKVYTINYHTVSEGDYLGEVRIILDATTVGLGIIDSAEYTIVQGDTVANVVLRFFEEYGFSTVYEGKYLRSIRRGDLCSGANIPSKLKNMIERDPGIEFRSHSRDSLGEFDFTSGSGWMYSINGTYPSRSLADYPLSRDTTICIRFTLAYGKDIGGEMEGNRYCGIWINGGYTPREQHPFGEPVIVEPTETEDGYEEYTCPVCGETKKEIIPATGEPTEPEATEPSTEPEETDPPATEPPETDPPTTEPPQTQPPETTPPVTDPPATDPPQVPETPPPAENEEEH